MTDLPKPIGAPKIEGAMRIAAASRYLQELEERYQTDRAAARAELQAAARALADIESASERLNAVAWAATNTNAAKNDLAWVIFQKEHQEYHLRKLLAGPTRDCQRCGKQAPAGHRFESSFFYCEKCETENYVRRTKESNEREQQLRARNAFREERISELKRKSPLNESDANELAALIIAQNDTPLFNLANFLDRHLP